MTYMVRPVQQEEIPYLVSMGKRLHGESLFRNMDYDEARVEKIGRIASVDENFFFHTIVHVPTEVPVGMLIAMMQDTFFGKDRIANDILFFVEPEHRAKCIAAVMEITSRYRHWAIHKGASRVYLIASSGIDPENTARAYDACGFKQIGTVHEAEERNMGTGSSGGSSNDATYWQNIQNDKDQQAAAAAQNALNDANARKDVAQQQFDAQLAQARSNAQGTAQTYFSDRGIPLDQSLVNSIINRVSVPSLDPNPESYFTPDIFSTGLAQSEQAKRQNLTTQVNNTFTPGFEKTLIPDSSIDPIVNSILGDQQKTAQTILDYNQKRGLLNPTGYQAAEDTLGQQASAGRSTLMDLANSVLGKDRSGLTDIAGNAGTAASNWTYGTNTPDFGSYYTQAQNLAGRDLSGLEGSIRGALGTANLFDVPSALAKGGTVQGPIDLTSSVAGGPLPTKDQKTASRGLGTTGVF